MEKLTMVLPKGKLLASSLQLLSRAGYWPPTVQDDSRRLLFEPPGGELRFILAKPEDVPTYVEYGAADLGIVGRDIVAESGCDVYEPLLLGFGHCRLVVAAPQGMEGEPLRLRPSVRVATKYPRLARDFFLSHGLSVEIVALRGSIELAPAVGLADLIVDVVETGRTLRENNLVERRTIMESQACLIVNRASHKLRLREISELIERIERVVEGND
ncbi:MAG: ATP phosphoribosyltransferase [Anaerolineae bacterium]